jgi:hypothetical protein
MKVDSHLWVLAGIIFIVLLISLSSGSSTPLPHYPDSLFPKHYPYEGFQSGLQPFPINNTENANQAATDVTRVNGIKGLYSAPLNGEKILDIYSHVESGSHCGASPYSNSMGYLCLDDNAKNMLITRGGNQTGRPSQIGETSV